MKRPLEEEPSAAERTSWYEVRDGRRHVVPYEHTYLSNAKGRWVGRRVLDVMLAEFPHICDDAYLTAAMGAGRLRRNGVAVGAQDVFARGDRLSHTVIRDEPSVPHADVEVLHEDDGLLVINKPAGVPVHHAGRFRRNTLVEILQLRHPPPGHLHVLHRLDRQTSGVLFLPKRPAEAAALSEAMRESRLRKRRRDEAEIRAEIQWTRRIDLDGATTASLDLSGKPAATRLAAVGYDQPTDTSLVLCEPLTGRTHQVRLHLQSIGHPIANDAVYGQATTDAHVDARESEGAGEGASSGARPAGDARLLDAGECDDSDELWLHAWRYRCEHGPELDFEAPPPEWTASFGPFEVPLSMQWGQQSTGRTYDDDGVASVFSSPSLHTEFWRDSRP